MVMEYFIKPKSSEKYPWKVLVVTILYALVAMFFSYQLFPGESSILSIAFITILFIPFIHKLFSLEEKHTTGNIFQRHRKAFIVYGVFFIAIIVAYTTVYAIIPQNPLFELQVNDIVSRGYSVSGQTVAKDKIFFNYFQNNTKVMFLAFILSTLFGTGAVFILSWNASIIAVYIGLLIRGYIAKGSNFLTAYGQGFYEGILAIGLHGIPEVTAYIFGGFAGGIFSVVILKEKYGTKKFTDGCTDALFLLAIAEFLIFISAILETFC